MDINSAGGAHPFFNARFCFGFAFPGQRLDFKHDTLPCEPSR
jgi:hypothetical protein